MTNNNNDQQIDSQKGALMNAAQSQILSETSNVPNYVQHSTSTNTNNMSNMNPVNKNVYTNCSVDTTGVSYKPYISTNENAIKPEYAANTIYDSKYVYEHTLPEGTVLYPQNYTTPNVNPLNVDRYSQIYMDNTYKFDENNNWKNEFPVQTEKYDGLTVQSPTNNMNKMYNMKYVQAPYISKSPTKNETVIMNKNYTYTEPHMQTNEKPFVQSNIPNDIQISTRQLHVQSNMMQQYEHPGGIPYTPHTSPKLKPCTVKPLSNMNPIFIKQNKRTSDHMTMAPMTPMTPMTPNVPMAPPPTDYTQSSRFVNYGNISPPVSHIHPNTMKPTLPILPNTEVHPMVYYAVSKNDKRCLLQKGIDCAMNKCKPCNNETHIPQYEYIIKSAGVPRTETVYSPHTIFRDKKKFDMFKKLTLKVGTCLDEIVNVMIDSLTSSAEVLHKNNQLNLHDLHAFYNPDPVYTRPERPTLKTGNNFIDKINNALDSTTLKKHQMLPKNNARILVPKTEKTGHAFIDGFNSILDNLLNEPLSYQKYDYFSEPTKVPTKTKKKINIDADTTHNHVK